MAKVANTKKINEKVQRIVRETGLESHNALRILRLCKYDVKRAIDKTIEIQHALESGQQIKKKKTNYDISTGRKAGQLNEKTAAIKVKKQSGKKKQIKESEKLALIMSYGLPADKAKDALSDCNGNHLMVEIRLKSGYYGSQYTKKRLPNNTSRKAIAQKKQSFQPQDSRSINDQILKIKRQQSNNGEVHEDSRIRFREVIVKSNSHRCRTGNHKLTEATANVYCLTRTGQIQLVEFMAGHCITCGTYYILPVEYDRLRKIGIPCCAIIDSEKVAATSSNMFFRASTESIMRQYGYTVSQQEDLSEMQRQGIISFLIESKILTKGEICSHLDMLIRFREYDYSRFGLAIEKWNNDRIYAADYKLGSYEKIWVNKIIK